MGAIITVFFVGGVCMVLGGLFIKKYPLTGIILTAIGILFFAALVFAGGPYEFGYGRIPNTAEDYTRRLDIGVVYHTLWSNENNKLKEVIVAVSPKDSQNPEEWRIVRVNGPAPPEYFTLIDGKPFGLIPPIGAK